MLWDRGGKKEMPGLLPMKGCKHKGVRFVLGAQDAGQMVFLRNAL